MSSNLIDSLQFATKQISIYIGLIALVSGIIGNVLNIIIFLSLKTFRETSCSFYLISASAVNIVQLVSSLMSRIIISGYGIDLTQTSIFLCKFRVYIWSSCCVLGLTYLCFATVDQFASLMDRWRHLCSVHVARRLVCIALVFWCAHGIPYLVFNNVYLLPISGQSICANMNPTFGIYQSRFVFPVLLGFLPIAIRVTFGMLSFFRVHSLSNRQVPLVRSERDKQLTSMVLLEVLVDVILTLPYVIFYIYYTNTILVDSLQIARATVIYTVTVIFFYSSGAASFYIYCCSSSRFRKQFLYVLIRIHLKRCRQRVQHLHENQVVPTSA